MKTNNKLEKQLNFLKNYLEIEVKNYSKNYLIVNQNTLKNNVFLTIKQPKLIDGKYGKCFMFKFDNGVLFVSKAKVCCCDENNVLSEWLICSDNQKWKDLANKANDLVYAKDYKNEILIKKHGIKNSYETEDMIKKIYYNENELKS